MSSVKTILFVENDLGSQSRYQKPLEREGFRVECAQDGQAALDVLSERAPDLVLLDLVLPKVSGADVLKFMHADPRLTTVPVIIFSNAPMAERPPDDPLVQGIRRLPKGDCSFPTLLSTIQETLAQAPEFVVMEAGKMPPGPLPAANGENQWNGTNAMPARYPDTETAFLKGRSEFLKEAAAMMSKIREQSMGYIKAPDSEVSRGHLARLQQHVRLLNSSAGLAGYPRVALLASVFDPLLCAIMDKPAAATPSILQTIAQTVDCLDGLLKEDDGYSSGPSFQARVLVVDDNTECNHVNVESLKRANFNAIGVKDPAAALSMLETTPFDLVVLEINLPGMSGFDLCAKLRRLPHHKKTPVIFVTALSNLDNRKQSVLCGGNDFLSKPVSPLELALKAAVNLFKARVRGGQGGALESKTPSASSNGSAANLQPAASTRLNQPAQNGTPSPEPSNRLTPGIKPPPKEDKPTIPLRMRQTEPSRPATPSEPNRQSNTQPSPVQAGNGTTQNGDIQERLHRTSAALEQAKAGLEQESAERVRLESRWREQLSGAEASVAHAQKVIKEKEAHCSRLAKELAESQRMKDELQTRFAAEQETAAKTREELKELKASLEKVSAERARLESEMRAQLDAAKVAAAQKETALKEKEARCSQLEKELSGLQQVRDKLQSRLAAEQQTSVKSQQTVNDLQERLRQSNAELGRVNTDLERQSVERKRLETEWREQLNAAKAAASRTEAMLAEKTTCCDRLEKELARLQQVRDEFQNQLAAEAEKAAKSQQQVKQLQEHLHQGNAELERVKAAREQESAKRVQLESECRNLTQARETLHRELHDLHERRTAQEAEWREKRRKLADGLRENIQLLQMRLRDAEGQNGDFHEVAHPKPQSR